MAAIKIDLAMTLGDFSLELTEQLQIDGVLGVVGSNGAGKTTLLRLLAGLDQPRRGRIDIGNDCWLDTAGRLAVPTHKRRVGMVFQDARLFPHLNVTDNLDFAARRAVGSAPAWDEVVQTLGLESLLQRRPTGLSGGEQQRVALARALMSAPQLLLLDEPLSAADRGYRDELLPYLRKVIHRFQIPTVYVAHTLDELAQLADQLLVLRGGRRVALGPIAHILARLDLPEVSGRDDVGSVIDAVVLDHDPAYLLTQLAFGDQTVSMTGLVGQPGQTLRLRLYATDIALAREKPEAISIRNILSASVQAIRVDPGSPSADVLLMSGGYAVRARVTRASLDELGLVVGQSVFALLKAVSLASD